MIPEIGHYALILSLCAALACIALPVLYKSQPSDIVHAYVLRLVKLQSTFMLFSFLTLAVLFYNNDFSVQYVQQNAHHNLPWFYRITAVWGGHEGSMLLWTTLLALWTRMVAKYPGNVGQTQHATILATLSAISSGLILFLLLTSNPFARFLPFVPESGSDLNPLLQDPGLICHPPLLYMGYVGLAVPFAAQICALFYPKCQSVLTQWTRKWLLVAWGFLTIGIVLGSYWAYYELGWGGYWFWDPVENASFMPWLVATALAHSIIITEKRHTFQAWTILLAIYAFSLSLIGTFLVRSGVLTSVHAFAVSPERGLFILIFLSVVIGLALALFCLRVSHIKAQSQVVQFAWFSKESILLLNNVILVTVASTVLLGTIYPLIIDALFSEKLSVGPPYFNMVFFPMMLPLVFIMAVAPSVYFYQDKFQRIWQNHKVALVVLVCLTPVLFYSSRSFWFTVGMLVGIWLILATIKLFFSKYQALQLHKIQTVGMLIAHMGVGVFIIGVTVSSQYSVEKDLELSVGQDVAIGPYHFKFSQLDSIKGPNYQGLQAKFDIEKNGRFLTTLYPQKRFYIPRELPLSETAIDSNLFRDIYIALSEATGQNTWAVRIYVKPFIIWIWLGGSLIALGALLSSLNFVLPHRQKAVRPALENNYASIK